MELSKRLFINSLGELVLNIRGDYWEITGAFCDSNGSYWLVWN